MADHVFTLLCRSASTDVFSGALTLTDIAEGLNAEAHVPIDLEAVPGGVAIIPGFDWVLVTALQRTNLDVAEELKGRVVIVQPGGQELPGPELTVDLKSSNTTRNITKLPYLPYSGNGVYCFQFQVHVDSAWVILGEHRVSVNFQQRRSQSS